MTDFQSPNGNVSTGARKKLHCPQCGSYEINITTESSVSGGLTTHSNSVSTTKLVNEHRNFWICNDCGAKFRNIQNLEDEIKSTKKNSIWSTIFFIISAVISGILIGMIVAKPWLALIIGVITLFTVLFAIISFVFIFVYKGRAKKMEKERDYLLEKCFN